MNMRENALALIGALDELHIDDEFDEFDALDELTDVQKVDRLARDLVAGALRLSFMLSEPDWGVGMLEDIAEIVGKMPNPAGEPRWDRH